MAHTRLVVPVSRHAVDSVNLKNPQLGVYEQCQQLVAQHGVTKGRIRLTLASGERHAGLTVNEYETLLMRHDLSEVLRDPLRFMAEKAGHMLGNPRAIPARTLDYAKYDLVRVFNQLLDAVGLHESMVESVLSRAIAMPASRFLRMKRVRQPARRRPQPSRTAARSSKAPTRARSWCSGTAAIARPASSTSLSHASFSLNRGASPLGLPYTLSRAPASTARSVRVAHSLPLARAFLRRLLHSAGLSRRSHACNAEPQLRAG